MPVVVTTRTIDRDTLDRLRRPRSDIVVERATGDDAWGMAEGPFRSYRRTLDATPHDATPHDATPAGGERYEVTERTEFALATGIWSPLINLLMRRALRSTDRLPRLRWWWPQEVVTQRTARLVSTLTVISILTGYLGTVIGQTITFAASDFGNGDADQANTLAATRIGVLISLVLLHRADRIGRRPLVLGLATAAVLFTLAGALSPNLLILGSTQTIARGLTTGLATLVALAAVEEVPAGVRAFAISLMAICAALGSGMVLWVLPLSDVIAGGWRIVYLVPAAFLPVLWRIARSFPETRRFDAATVHRSPSPINWRRFALLGGAAFLAAIFLAPASQLRNEYLRDDLGYSASAVSLFLLVIFLPGGAALVAAGVMADRIGRRWIGAIGLGAGALLGALSYQLDGPGLWLVASGYVLLTGAAVPALGTYKTELFPTRARARVGALFDVVGVTGSALGLVAVGYLAERWNDLGSAIGVMVVAPVLVAVAIVALFPETASYELEHFNPHDPGLERPSVPEPGRSPSPAGVTGRPGEPERVDEAILRADSGGELA
jgi:MFS family permease